MKFKNFGTGGQLDLKSKMGGLNNVIDMMLLYIFLQIFPVNTYPQFVLCY